MSLEFIPDSVIGAGIMAVSIGITQAWRFFKQVKTDNAEIKLSDLISNSADAKIDIIELLRAELNREATTVDALKSEVADMRIKLDDQGVVLAEFKILLVAIKDSLCSVALSDATVVCPIKQMVEKSKIGKNLGA